MRKRKLEYPPFLFITPAIIVGIVFALNFSLQNVLYGAAIALVISIVFAFIRRIYEPITVLIFFILGALLYNANKPICNINFNQNEQYIATIDEVPILNKRYYKCQAQILAQKKDSVWSCPKNSVILYIDSTLKPTIGQVISYQSKSYQFDSVFKTYYSNKNIFARQYIYQSEILDTIVTFENSLNSFRNLLANKIQNLNPALQNATSIVNSITLGDKSKLDTETKVSYRNTGLSHILAISGLHIGIIYAMLSFAFAFLLRFREGRIVRFVAITLILWGYAMLSGLSPSVLRAVIMFTLFGIGELSYQRKNSLNILFISAFFILIFDPMSLYDLSFQLSYIAMIGIIMLYNPIFYTINPKNKIGRWAWQLFSLTAAAQIATAPIILYYFNQISLLGFALNYVVWFTVPLIIVFATLFLLTNINFVGEISVQVANLQNIIIDKTAAFNIGVIYYQPTIYTVVLAYVLMTIGAVIVVQKSNNVYQKKVKKQVKEILQKNG